MGCFGVHIVKRGKMKATNYRVQEDIPCCANCFWSSWVGGYRPFLCSLRNPHGEESLEVDEVGICDAFQLKEEALDD